MENKTLNNWRGIEEIGFVSNGEYSDPSLIYKGYEFNYWDIESALWEMFLEDRPHYNDSIAGNAAVEQEFSDYLKNDTAVSYLEDVLMGGYFPEDSQSWRGGLN